MGVVLDSSISIAGERRRDSVWEVPEREPTGYGEANPAHKIHWLRSQRGGIHATGRGGADEPAVARGVVPGGSAGECEKTRIRNQPPIPLAPAR
jgi:hypothetical protein